MGASRTSPALQAAEQQFWKQATCIVAYVLVQFWQQPACFVTHAFVQFWQQTACFVTHAFVQFWQQKANIIAFAIAQFWEVWRRSMEFCREHIGCAIYPTRPYAYVSDTPEKENIA